MSTPAINPRGSNRLQDQILKKDSVFKSRSEAILNNLKIELPKLPNEDNIASKLDDEEELLVLYQQVSHHEASKPQKLEKLTFLAERKRVENQSKTAEYDKTEAHGHRGKQEHDDKPI